MTTKESETGVLFEQLRAELVAWRAAHPEATWDEIAAQVTPRRQQLMGALCHLSGHTGPVVFTQAGPAVFA